MRLHVLLCSFILIAWCGRDFYKILRIPRSATTKEIKSAYRKLAKEIHPDFNKDDPNAESKFQDISRAYQVLSNADQRSIYDKHGEEGLDQNSQFNNFQGFDVFRSMFGSFFGFENSAEDHTVVRGADVVMDLFVTLEEVYEGEFVEIIRNKPVKKQASGSRQCNCRTEMKATSLGGGQFTMMQHKVCDTCPNVKFVTEEQLIDVEIEVGVEDKHVYTFKGEGEPHVDGDPGDLKVVINIEKHSVFQRIRNNLYANVTISLEDALVGFKFNITHLDGHKVLVNHEDITRPGEVFVLKGEGMPDYTYNRKRGNLYITFDIDFPTIKFSDIQKSEIRKLLGKTSLTTN